MSLTRINGVSGFDDLVAELRTEVAEGLAAAARADLDEGKPPAPFTARQALALELITRALDRRATETMNSSGTVLDPTIEDYVGRRVIDALFGLGGFQRLLEDPLVETINANGADRVFVQYADGRRERVNPIAASDDELVALIRQVAARAGLEERRFDRASPALTVQLPDESRLFAIMTVSRRPYVSIRHHRFMRVTLDDLVANHTLSRNLANLLRALVLARRNFVVIGGMGDGKTTMLRTLAAEIPGIERVGTIEDTFELGLDGDEQAHPDAIAFQARDPNVEGEGAIDQAELVRLALRAAADRIIVGEVRGAEVIPMLNAMNQGSDGSMTTLHASSTASAFAKLQTYALQAPEHLPVEASAMLIATAVHFVLHVERIPNGRRVVTSLREVAGAEGPMVASNELYAPGPDRAAVPTGVALRGPTLDALRRAGFDPRDLIENPDKGRW